MSKAIENTNLCNISNDLLVKNYAKIIMIK